MQAQAENELGLSPDLYQQVLSGYGGSPPALEQGWRDLSNLAGDSMPALPVLAARYPRETGAMVRAYQQDPQQVEAGDNPLLEAARQAGARHILQDLFGEQGNLRLHGDGQGT